MATKKKANVRSPLEMVAEELGTLTQGTMLRGRVGIPASEDPKFVEALHSYIALNQLSKVIEKRMAALKPLLHEVAETEGKKTENGGFETVIAGNTVTRERRRATAPDDTKLRALLETRGIKVDKVYDTVEALVLNPSRLQYLMDHGDLKEEDVEPLHGITWAIKAEAGKELEAVLRKAFLSKKNDDEESPQTEKAARKARK